MPGTLFVVATPIGNLEDITLRALRVLREVDVIAAEDTRRTAKLLAHYQIDRPLTSLREHNEARMSASLVDRMAAGQSVALVSDAGTPAIADPGARFVRLARERGITVVPIPGPSAVAAALSVAGFELNEFVFMGYPPPAGRARSAWMRRACEEPRPVVFYEAPHRVRRTLREIADSVERHILVARELTKIHEQSVVGPISTAAENPEERGEYALVLGPIAQIADSEPDAATAARIIRSLVEGANLSNDEALMFVAKATGTEPRAVAKAVKKHNILVKQRTDRSS